MAISKTGGVYGFLRGSVGSATYTTQKGSDGKKEQVVRQKATDVANPNTVAQIMQRCKIAPAQRFKKALESIVNHSFEGVVYGQPSLQHFLSLAMKEQGPYIPKSINQVYPYTYQISEGSILPVSLKNVSDPSFADGDRMLIGEKVADGVMGSAQFYQLYPGAQITTIRCILENGLYTFKVARAIINERWTEDGEVTVYDDVLPELGIGAYSDINRSLVFYNEVVAGCVIISRQDESGNWLRSSQKMVLQESFLQNLTNADAINLTLASYQTGADLNKINSSWFLNMGAAQAFGGQVVSDILLTMKNTVNPYAAGDVLADTLLGGNIVENGRVNGYVFTTDGTANGFLLNIVESDNGYKVETVHGTNANIKASDVNLGEYRILAWSPAYFNQLGYDGNGAASVWKYFDPEP